MKALVLSLITLVALSSAGTAEALTVTEKCLMKTHLIVGAFKKCLANQSAKVAKGKAENTDQGDAKCAARFEKTWNKNRDKSLQDDPGAAACNAATTDAIREMQEAAALVAAGRSLDPYAELNLSDLGGSGIAAEADLDECEVDLGTTTGSLNTCTADLGSANTALATCELDLAICNAPPTPSPTPSPTPTPTPAGLVFAADLGATDGSWNFQNIVGLGGAQASCSNLGAHLCTRAELVAAHAEGSLNLGLDYWVYDPAANAGEQCSQWTYHTGHTARGLRMNGATGDIIANVACGNGPHVTCCQ